MYSSSLPIADMPTSVQRILLSIPYRSPEWKLLSAKEKEDIGLTYDDDGEFW
jgi:hypothetical protein